MSTDSSIKRALNVNNLLFITQVSCIFIVICVSLCNLTLQNGNQHLWTMILTNCMAFLMPGPKFKMVEPEQESRVELKSIKPNAEMMQQQQQDGGLCGSFPR